MTDCYIYDALRTPRALGKTSGALYEVKPIDLLRTVLIGLQRRTGVQAAQLDDAIIGCVTPTDDQGFNIARSALVAMGWEAVRGGMQINRYCTSGLEAVNLAAAKIGAGYDQLIAAGGVESMSRIPMGADGGPLMYDPATIVSSQYLPQGVAADLLATLEGYDRSELDHYALRSHQRASAAQAAHYFDGSIEAITDRNDQIILATDECVRPTTSLEALAALSPSFLALGQQGFGAMALHRYPVVEAVRYLHTAGNSCSLADGAAVVLLGNDQQAERLGRAPRARIVVTASASVNATLVLTAGVEAAQQALQRAQLSVADIDLWEVNEAFAAVVLHFQRTLGIDDDLINVNGGAIAFGHPLGATGAMLLNVLLDELERRDLKRGMVVLCAGAGLGIATIIERV